MTLIEIMIVMGLMGLLMGTVLMGSGIMGGANRRAAASLIVTGVRKGLAHANTTGKPVRLRMDLDGGKLVLEESSSRQVLRQTDEQEEEQAEKDAGAELLASAEAAAEAIISGSARGGPSFSAVDLLGQDGESPGRELGSGIRFVKVHTEHDEDPLTEGEAFLYFWPGGVTERAVIQIARLGDDDGLTIEVSPLTGRADIKRGFTELPEEVLDGEEFSERDE